MPHPTPPAILIVSAHWESAPLTLGATETGVPLTYDFYGFPERFYRMTYRSPGAPALAARARGAVAGNRAGRGRPPVRARGVAGRSGPPRGGSPTGPTTAWTTGRTCRSW